MDPHYLLGSTSTYRAELLARLQLPFTTARPVCDETPLPSEPPDKLASRLAKTKALSLQHEHPNAVIIGSDQVAALGELVIGKPGTFDTARRQLRSMRGKSVVFYTAVSVVDVRSGQILNALDETTATLRDLSNTEIDRYLEIERPLDCAGSFKIEGLVAAANIPAMTSSTMMPKPPEMRLSAVPIGHGLSTSKRRNNTKPSAKNQTDRGTAIMVIR